MTGARHKKVIYAIMIKFTMHPDKKYYTKPLGEYCGKEGNLLAAN